MIVTIKDPIRPTIPILLHFLRPAKLADEWFAADPGTWICLMVTTCYELQSDGEEKVMEDSIILELG